MEILIPADVVTVNGEDAVIENVYPDGDIAIRLGDGTREVVQSTDVEFVAHTMPTDIVGRL